MRYGSMLIMPVGMLLTAGVTSGPVKLASRCVSVVAAMEVAGTSARASATAIVRFCDMRAFLALHSGCCGRPGRVVRPEYILGRRRPSATSDQSEKGMREWVVHL